MQKWTMKLYMQVRRTSNIFRVDAFDSGNCEMVTFNECTIDIEGRLEEFDEESAG
jgi:hypothetical protein